MRRLLRCSTQVSKRSVQAEMEEGDVEVEEWMVWDLMGWTKEEMRADDGGRTEQGKCKMKMGSEAR